MKVWWCRDKDEELLVVRMLNDKDEETLMTW